MRKLLRIPFIWAIVGVSGIIGMSLAWSDEPVSKPMVKTVAEINQSPASVPYSPAPIRVMPRSQPIVSSAGDFSAGSAMPIPSNVVEELAQYRDAVGPAIKPSVTALYAISPTQHANPHDPAHASSPHAIAGEEVNSDRSEFCEQLAARIAAFDATVAAATPAQPLNPYLARPVAPSFGAQPDCVMTIGGFGPPPVAHPIYAPAIPHTMPYGSAPSYSPPSFSATPGVAFSVGQIPVSIHDSKTSRVRTSAFELDQMAHQLECQEEYERADELRELAKKWRVELRGDAKHEKEKSEGKGKRAARTEPMPTIVPAGRIILSGEDDPLFNGATTEN